MFHTDHFRLKALGMVLGSKLDLKKKDTLCDLVNKCWCRFDCGHLIICDLEFENGEGYYQILPKTWLSVESLEDEDIVDYVIDKWEGVKCGICEERG